MATAVKASLSLQETFVVMNDSLSSESINSSLKRTNSKEKFKPKPQHCHNGF